MLLPWKRCCLDCLQRWPMLFHQCWLLSRHYQQHLRKRSNHCGVFLRWCRCGNRWWSQISHQTDPENTIIGISHYSAVWHISVMPSQITGNITVCSTSSWSQQLKLLITGPLWGESMGDGEFSQTELVIQKAISTSWHHPLMVPLNYRIRTYYSTIGFLWNINKRDPVDLLGLLLLIWININPSMDK